VAAVVEMRGVINRQCSRIKKQVESRINHQNQSINIHPILYQPDTGATLAL
jgi:hypothetical protein